MTNKEISYYGFLCDCKGNRCIRRLSGSMLLFIAVIMSIILFGYSVTVGAKDSQTALSIISMLALSGGSLLGIGAFEHFANRGTK